MQKGNKMGEPTVGPLASAARPDWTLKNTYFLMLMTVGYIIGEIAHFLINTTNRAVARDVHFGDKSCYLNASFYGSDSVNGSTCSAKKNQSECDSVSPECEWNYSGVGIQYQVLSGTIFVWTFVFCSLAVGFTSDKIAKSAFGRHRLMAVGVLIFSASCLLFGFSQSYWHLVILRVGIAAGEAVCRPISAGMIADAFSPSGRALANGVFSWGIYFGYGLAYVIGINLTQLDVLGYSWRASYVIPALPGFVIAALLFVTVKDPASEARDEGVIPDGVGVSSGQSSPDRVSSNASSERAGIIAGHQKSGKDGVLAIALQVAKSLIRPEMVLLILGAIVRQTGGLSWAFNTRPYFQQYYPKFNSLSLWLLGCSVGGGGFGVFFGGWLSDRLVKKLGLHSRLWVLGAFQLLAAPWAALVLYFQPPGALVCLIFYYFFSETWFAVLFTVITEVCQPQVKSTCIAVFLFLMNSVGGNLPVVVDPVSKAIGYREAIYLFWPGCVALSGVIFLIASFPLLRRRQS